MDAWQLRNLLLGLGKLKNWIPLAFDVMMLQHSAFRQVADQAIVTGPALLLGIIGTLNFFSTRLTNDFSWQVQSFQIAAWFITVFIMYLAGRLLRGTGTFTSVLRVMGFAYGIYLLEVFSLIPAITSMVHFLVSLLVFIAVWTGVAIAHHLKGWRTLILPVVYILVFLLSIVILYSLSSGLTLTLESLAADFGLR